MFLNLGVGRDCAVIILEVVVIINKAVMVGRKQEDAETWPLYDV